MAVGVAEVVLPAAEAAPVVGRGIFPLPLPQATTAPSSKSRRARKRKGRRALKHRLTVRAVSALNNLYASREVCVGRNDPVVCPASGSVCVDVKATPLRSRVVTNIERAVSFYADRVSHGSVHELKLLDEHGVCDYMDTRGIPTAVPLRADRVSLPTRAAVVPLIDLLPDEEALRYKDQNNLVVSDFVCTPTTIDPKDSWRGKLLLCPRVEYVALVRRMMLCGMVTLDLVPYVVNGVFALAKGDKQQLIINAVPANRQFVEPPHIDLPGPDVLASIVVPEGRTLYVGKCDLKDFYHCLALPSWLVPFFGLPAVRRSEVGLEGDGWVWPCVTSVPMGWSFAVHATQTAHVHVAQSGLGLCDSDFVSKFQPSLLSGPRLCVYVDDTIFLSLDEKVAQQWQARYARLIDGTLGLTLNVAKTVAPCCRGVTALGMLLCSSYGLDPPKLSWLVDRTLVFADRHRATGFELSRLLGFWSWAALARRCSYAVFNSVYRFVESAQGRSLVLWLSVRGELRIMAGLAPLLFTSLDVTYARELMATDASSLAAGVTVSRLPKTVVRDIAQSAVRTGVPRLCPSLLPSLIASRWLTLVSFRWRHPEHINILELRALVLAVRWFLSLSLDHSSLRLVVLVDSTVVCGAVNKGRSSSYALLCVLRQLSALLLASGLTLEVLWIPTDANPADAPSRLFLAVEKSAPPPARSPASSHGQGEHPKHQ